MWLYDQVGALTDSKETVSVADYAEERRVMPKGTPFPGPVQNERTPYLVEFMDDMSEASDIETSVFMKSIQIGATWAVENFMACIIDKTPGPILYATANLALGKEWSEKRFDPMMEQCGLTNKIFAQTEKSHSKKTGDTSLSKEFPGGQLKVVGYNSAGSLRSTSFRFFLGDEIDEAKNNLKKQGSTLEIAEGRTVAYESNRKIILFSSPTEQDTSQIYKAYMKGDQRKYFVPCPYCDHKQILDFHLGMVYERDKDDRLVLDSVGYKCQNEDCGKVFKNYHKSEILHKGEWRPTAKAIHERYRSRHINALYAPPGMIKWENVVQKYIESVDSHDAALEQSFENLYLGLPYQERGEAPETSHVISHRRNYMAKTVPDDVVYLTLGGDVQGDRIELEVLGHSRQYKTFSIDYQVIKGSTEVATEGAFAKFTEMFMNGEFVYSNHKGKFAPQMALLDSGYRGDIVTSFCETCPGIYPSVGQAKFASAHKRFEINDLPGSKMLHIRLATNLYKDRVYSSLRVDHPKGTDLPPLYPSFPANYPDSYFKMLNAEYKRKRTVGGKTFYEYFCPSGRRNEALDCRVYNLCAAEVIYYLSVKNVLQADFDKIEQKSGRKMSIQDKVEMFFIHMEKYAIM